MEKVLEEKLPELLQVNPSDVFLWKLYTTGDFFLHREKHPPKKLCMLRQKSVPFLHDCMHDCHFTCTIVTGSQEAYRRLMKCNARSVSKKFQTLKTSTALEGIPSLCHVFRRVPSVGDQDKSFDR